MLDKTKQTAFYDRVWSVGHLWQPDVWPEWEILARLLPNCPDRLEIGPGLRPRLPIADTWFVDLSTIALSGLRAHEGRPICANAEALPFASAAFDLIVACEVVEHLECDREALLEIGRVLRDDGYLLMSVPLDPKRWTAHDDAVGHFRRYDPAELVQLLETRGFVIVGFCPQIGEGYNLLKRLSAWLLHRVPLLAIRLEDRVTLPIGVRVQRPVRKMLLTLPPDTEAPGGFLLCRKRSS